jgi:mannose-6-phosphate isomerase-like protein (cupin superfamily)
VQAGRPAKFAARCHRQSVPDELFREGTMKLRLSGLRVLVVLALLLGVMGPLLAPSTATAQQKFVITPIAEKKVKQLPTGSLYWRVENFPTLAQARAAAGTTSLAAEAAGKAWLFTLGAKGGSTPGGTELAEIGPVPPISAPEYLLRINHASGPPGVRTRVHSHPGSETFYVLSGRLYQRTPSGVVHVEAGQSMPGHVPGTTMQVSSGGTSDLNALVMFVADATKPFSSPAKFE